MGAFNSDGTLAGSNAKAPSAVKLSWLQKHLSEIGGGGGAVAGGITGAAVGSVVPVIGTGIGGIIGAGLGGLLGGSAGEAAEKTAEGHDFKDVQGDVLKEGALQGLYGAGGEVGGQLIGRGLGAVLGKVAGKGAEVAASPVESLLAQGAKAPSRVTGLAPHEVQRILETVPETAKTLTGLGVTTPEKIAGAADLTTGKTGYLNSFVRRFVDAGGPVDVTKTQGAADTALRNLTDPVAKREVTKNIGDILGKLRLSDNPIGSNVIGHSEPGNVFDAIQTLDQHMASSDSKPAITAYKSVKDALEKSLFKEGGANAVAAGYKLGPEEASQILADAKAQGLPKVGQHIVDTVNNASDISTLRSAQAPFVNAGKAAQGFERSTVGTTGILNNLRSAHTPFQMANAPFKAAAQSNLASSLGRLAGKAVEVPASLGAAAVDNLGSTLGRVGAQGAVRAQSLTPSQEAPVEQASIMDATGADTASPDTASSSSAFTPETLQALAIHDIQATGGKNLDKIAQLDKLFGSGSKAGAASSTEANTISNAKSAISQLDSIEKALQSGRGSVGPISGRVRSLNPYDTDQKTLDSQFNMAAQTVAKGLEGGKLSDQDIKRYREMLPTITDTRETALSKLANVRGLLQQQLGGYTDLTGLGQ